jgi:hypothetical protein
MADVHLWCRVAVVDGDGLVTETHLLAGPGEPGVGAVDDLARLVLSAARGGATVVLDQVAPAMSELLELSGLGVEVQR